MQKQNCTGATPVQGQKKLYRDKKTVQGQKKLYRDKKKLYRGQSWRELLPWGVEKAFWDGTSDSIKQEKYTLFLYFPVDI